MENILASFTNCMAFENGISEEAATSMTKWLENEGVLDYAILKETYAEPADASGVTPTLHLVSNDV